MEVQQAMLSLTEDEWNDLLTCIQLRIASINFDEDEDPDNAEKWTEELQTLAHKVRSQAESQGVNF